jgi:peptidyl-prolyl cis-trans isomerase C
MSRSVMQIAAALAVAGAALGGCGGSEPAAPEAEAAILEDSAVAAIVNGEPIYVSDVELEAEAQGLVEPGEKTLEVDSAEFNRVLDQLIDVRLLAVEARTRGLDEDPHVRQRLQAARDRILGNVLVEDIVAERVGAAEIRKMYEEQVAIMELGEEARVRHILAPTKEAIDAVVAELKTGKDFAVLAANKSADDVTRLDGGDLGYMKEDESTPEFARAIRNTPTGGVSRPFETQEGWHVIKVEERRPEQPPSMEELRPLILEYLTRMQLDDVLKELRQKAQIQRSASPQNDPLDTDPFLLAPEGADRRPAEPARPSGPLTFDAAAPEAAPSEPAPPADAGQAAPPATPAPVQPAPATPAPQNRAPAAPVGETRPVTP